MSVLVEDIIAYLDNYPIKIGDSIPKYKGLKWDLVSSFGDGFISFFEVIKENPHTYRHSITKEEYEAIDKAIRRFKMRENLLGENHIKEILGI